MKIMCPTINAGGAYIRGYVNLLRVNPSNEFDREWCHISDFCMGDYVGFQPTVPVGYGPGLLTRSGDFRRNMSVGEMWSLGLSWLLPPARVISKKEIFDILERNSVQVEYPTLLEVRDTFLGKKNNVTACYRRGISLLNTPQLRGLLRGMYAGAVLLESLGTRISGRISQAILARSLKSSIGLFAQHYGIIGNVKLVGRYRQFRIQPTLRRLLPTIFSDNVSLDKIGPSIPLVPIEIEETRVSLVQVTKWDRLGDRQIIGFPMSGVTNEDYPDV